MKDLSQQIVNLLNAQQASMFTSGSVPALGLYDLLSSFEIVVQIIFCLILNSFMLALLFRCAVNNTTLPLCPPHKDTDGCIMLAGR